jgi:hypothetical protein
VDLGAIRDFFITCAETRQKRAYHPPRTIRRRFRTAHDVPMNPPAERSESSPVRDLYQLRVAGPIPADLVRDLEGLRMSVEPAETVLYGRLADQSALFGLLARIHDFGLQLLEVRRMTELDMTEKE